MLNYFPGLLAFVAALMGIIGAPKWNASRPGLRRLTPLGWAALVIALGSMMAGVIVTWRAQQGLDLQARQRRVIRSIAHAEARMAVRVITDPFFVLFHDDTVDSELKLLPTHVLDEKALDAVEKIDLRSPWQTYTSLPLGQPPPSSGWWTVFKEHADRGALRTDRALQIYSAYLDPDTLWLLARLRSSEFLVLRLQGIDEFVTGNRHVSFLPFPFVPPHVPDGSAWSEFWDIVSKLDHDLERDPSRLKRRL